MKVVSLTILVNVSIWNPDMYKHSKTVCLPAVLIYWHWYQCCSLYPNYDSVSLILEVLEGHVGMVSTNEYDETQY